MYKPMSHWTEFEQLEGCLHSYRVKVTTAKRDFTGTIQGACASDVLNFLLSLELDRYITYAEMVTAFYHNYDDYRVYTHNTIEGVKVAVWN